MNAALLAARLVLAAVFCAAGAAKLSGRTGTRATAAYAYAGTPSAVAVAADGRIASQVAAGPDGVRALAAAVLAGNPAGDMP